MPRTTEAVKRSRSVSRLKKEFTDLGVDMTGTEEAKFSNTPNKRKTREKSRENAKKAKMDVEGGSAQKTRYVNFGTNPSSIHSLIRGVLIQSCSAGDKNFTNYVFCHPQFSGVIQNIENYCAILTLIVYANYY